MRAGSMPGQFILQYYVDNTARKLKGSVDLDQCEQVRQIEALVTKSIETMIPG